MIAVLVCAAVSFGWFGLAPERAKARDPAPADATADDAEGDDDRPDERDDGDAAASRRVLLVTTDHRDTATDDAALARQRRTRAELEAAGFDVLAIGLTEAIDGLDEARLDALAREYDAVALVVLHPSRVQADVWTRDDDEDVGRRAVVVGGLGPAENDAVFALRVTEVLQATLIAVELPPREPAAPKTAPAPSPPPAPATPTPPRWAARVGAHAAGTTGDLGFMFGPTLGTTFALGPKRRLGIDVEAYATALPGRIRTEAGQASVGFGLLRGTIGVWPLPAARVSPGIGLGWGMLVAWTRGRADDPYRGRSDVTVVSTPVAAGDLAIAVTRHFRIRLGFRIGVALPAVRVQTSTGSVRTAQPLADGGVAFEITY